MSVDLERRGNVAVLTLNRPDALNAMSPEMLDALDARLDEIAGDDDLRCAVLTGAGDRAFCAGADIKAMQSATALEARAYAGRGHQVLRRIETLPTPVIAAVNGLALGGGCELALACDFRLASEKAGFGQPEVKLGILPGWGGTQRLSRLTSPGIAKEMIFTGDIIHPDVALRIGLVNHVHPVDALLDEAVALAEKIAAGPGWAISAAKALCNDAMGVELDEGLDREADVFALAFTTSDQREGMSAFLEKRAATFTGG